MSFRKRNIALTSSTNPPNTEAAQQRTPRAQETTSNTTTASSTPSHPSKNSPSTDPYPTTSAATNPRLSQATPTDNAPSTPGTRPSPLDGRPTTSTGTPSLDALLSGHAAQPLGSSLLLQERGTTDYAGALLRCYAAEGVLQGHVVHVVGLPAGSRWGSGLPGCGKRGEDRERRGGGVGGGNEREMKIAWRYGERFSGGGGPSERNRSVSHDARNPSDDSSSTNTQQPFCHTFDLAKRLEHPSTSTIHYHALSPTSANPFTTILQSLRRHITTSSPQTLHRIVIPSLLSPALYPPTATHPSHLLTFLHSLRSLLRQHPLNLVALLSLPTSLHPRSTGLTCYTEILTDGVLEFIPFPHREDVDDDDTKNDKLGTSGAATKDEERPQGLVKVWKLPGYHERGGGGGGGKAVERALGDDLAFMVSRRRFWIGAFHLPPAEAEKREEEEKGKGGTGVGAEKGLPDQKDLEF